MTSYLDLLEQLNNHLEKEQLIYYEDTGAFKNKTIAISGKWFLEKVLNQSTGDILTGFSQTSVKREVLKLKNFFDDLKCKFKVVFDGETVIKDSEKFKNDCHILTNLHHMYWKMEVCKRLFEK